MASVTLTFWARLASKRGLSGPRLAKSMAKATGMLQNAARLSCQQKKSDPAKTMEVEMTAPQSSPSTWL